MDPKRDSSPSSPSRVIPETGRSPREELLQDVKHLGLGGIRDCSETADETRLVDGSDLVEDDLAPLALEGAGHAGRGTALTPAWGLEVDLVVPCVFDEPYDGSIASGVTLNFDHTLSQSTLFSWNVGILVPEDSQGDRFAQGFFTAAFAGFVSRDIQLYVDGALNVPSDGSGTDPAALLGCGGYLYLGNRVVIWAAYDFGLTSVSPDGTAKLGISFAF